MCDPVFPPSESADQVVGWPRGSFTGLNLEVPLDIRAHLRIRLHTVLLTSASMLIGTGCSRAPSANPRSVDAVRKNATNVAAVVPRLPICPPTRSPMLQASSLTGHHSVILSWNASVPSAGSRDESIGYCLYRSTTKKAAKKNPGCSDCKAIDSHCSNCEQVNSAPVKDVVCVDDLVENGAIYAYVVTAISGRGMSSPSNVAPVEIPVSNQRVGLIPLDSYPLCRGRASPKLGPT